MQFKCINLKFRPKYGSMHLFTLVGTHPKMKKKKYCMISEYFELELEN